jgi:NRPS condensation-like uncharacterized protein
MEYKLITERLSLYIPNGHVCFVVEPCKILDIAFLREAVKKVLQKHPILRSSIRVDENGKAYYHVEDEVEPEFYVKTINNDRGWISTVAEEQKKPFILSQPPLIRFICLKNESKMQLVMCVHHILADGLSGIRILQDIISFVENPEQTVTVQQVALLEDSMLYSNEKLSLLMRMLAGRLNKQWQRSSHIFSEVEYNTMRKSYWSQRSHIIDLAELDASETSKLIAKCKENHVTVNNLLIATLLGATQKIDGISKENKRLGMGVSFNSNEMNVGNFVSPVSINYVYNPKKSIWDNTRVIQALVKRKLNCNKTKYFALTFIKALNVNLIDSVYFGWFGDFSNKATDRLRNIFGYIKKPTHLGITNLGKIGLSAEHGIKDTYFIPPITVTADKLAGIVTTNTEMKIVYQYFNQENSKVNRQIFEDWLDRLRKL